MVDALVDGLVDTEADVLQSGLQPDKTRVLQRSAGVQLLSIKTASSPYGAGADSYQSNSKVTSRLRQGVPSKVPIAPAPNLAPKFLGTSHVSSRVHAHDPVMVSIYWTSRTPETSRKFGRCCCAPQPALEQSHINVGLNVHCPPLSVHGSLLGFSGRTARRRANPQFSAAYGLLFINRPAPPSSRWRRRKPVRFHIGEPRRPL